MTAEIFTTLGGFLVGMSLAPSMRALTARRRPVQIFEGRVFPHPLDERWQVTQGRAWLGDVTLTRQYKPGVPVTWTVLRIGDVEIAGGGAPERYLAAVEKACRQRVLAKALESIP